MRTIYRYTNNMMAGWEFVILQDNGTDGYYVTGNSASTAENMSQYDLKVTVRTKKELKEMVERLEWMGKYTNHGRN